MKKYLLVMLMSAAVLSFSGCSKDATPPRESVSQRIERQKQSIAAANSPSATNSINTQAKDESALGLNNGLTKEQLAVLERETVGPTNRNFWDEPSTETPVAQREPAQENSQETTSDNKVGSSKPTASAQQKGVEFGLTANAAASDFSGTDNELKDIRRIFPKNGAWESSRYYTDNLGNTHTGGPALVMAIQDYVYGKAEQVKHIEFNQLKPGDVVLVKNNNEFGLFVTSVTDTSLTGIVYGNKIEWESSWEKEHLKALQGVMVVSRTK